MCLCRIALPSVAFQSCRCIDTCCFPATGVHIATLQVYSELNASGCSAGCRHSAARQSATCALLHSFSACASGNQLVHSELIHLHTLSTEAISDDVRQAAYMTLKLRQTAASTALLQEASKAGLLDEVRDVAACNKRPVTLAFACKPQLCYQCKHLCHHRISGRRQCGGLPKMRCHSRRCSASAAASGACDRLPSSQHSGLRGADACATLTDVQILKLKSVSLHRSRHPAADGGPWLHTVAAGGGLALSPPPPRTRPPELEARLAQLQKRLDEKQYADMVADVTVEVTTCGQICTRSEKCSQCP